MAALREHGVQAPAQVIYELRLDGYAIDRGPCESSDRHMTIGSCTEIAGKSGAGASTALRAVRAELSTHGEWEIEVRGPVLHRRCFGEFCHAGAAPG